MKISKERKELEKDLILQLRYIKNIAPDSREKFDLIIQKNVEKLKELGEINLPFWGIKI